MSDFGSSCAGTWQGGVIKCVPCMYAFAPACAHACVCVRACDVRSSFSLSFSVYGVSPMHV
jgi:hypothetical protein